MFGIFGQGVMPQGNPMPVDPQIDRYSKFFARYANPQQGGMFGQGASQLLNLGGVGAGMVNQQPYTTPGYAVTPPTMGGTQPMPYYGNKWGMAPTAPPAVAPPPAAPAGPPVMERGLDPDAYQARMLEMMQYRGANPGHGRGMGYMGPVGGLPGITQGMWDGGFTGIPQIPTPTDILGSQPPVVAQPQAQPQAQPNLVAAPPNRNDLVTNRWA